jgi:hypothetical protein
MSEKITPCSTPSVPFDIKLFTPKLKNSDILSVLYSLISSGGFFKFDLQSSPEAGGSSSQHALQLINIHNHDFSQC